MTPILKRTILFSLLGHLAVFSLFNFSFGRRYDADYRGFYFWGTFLPVSNPLPVSDPDDNLLRRILNHPYNATLKKTGDSVALPRGYLRPQFFPAPSQEKMTWLPEGESVYPRLARKEPVMMLYPGLPYEFSLYFRDRQAAHIELAFNIKTVGGREEVAIKRKISSGNLEADLLSMRYIGHYLFIQKTRFAPGVWQSVKIDLAAKDDHY